MHRTLVLSFGAFAVFGADGFLLQRSRPLAATLPVHAIDRFKGETEKEYFQRITAAASDPAAFENMVMNEQQEQKPPPPSLPVEMDEKTSEKPNQGYVRVEEWEAEQQKLKGEMSWEERVQWDGQQHGNGFNQNEILRKNLNGF